MKILSLILLLAFFGCENDPYPKEGNLRTEPRGENTPVPMPLGMIVKPLYEFQEGKTTRFTIKVNVPPPGTADMKVDNLPAGATFNAETRTVEWKPGIFDGNDPQDPTIKSRVYPITVWLRSSEDITEAIEKVVLLEVYDVPLNFEIDGRNSVEVKEGRTLEYEFSIDNIDYPQGPFTVTTEGMPSNSRVEKITGSETQFKLIYSPDYDHVQANGQNDCSWGRSCLKYEGKIIVHNPANHRSEKDVTIEIQDERLDPKLVVPQNMEQGLDINFQVAAYDTNSEISPRITFEGRKPEVGEFSTSLVKNKENNSSVLNVSWKDIPPSYNGKSFTFRYEACALARRNNYSNCVRGSHTVKIVVKDRKAPIITRDSWKPGEIKYLDFGKSQRFGIDIEDGDDYALDMKTIKIVPEEMRRYVSYNNGRLSVGFGEAGIHQFSIVATSQYNMSSSESFVVEVFKKDRTRILYFTDTTRNAEVKFFKKTMKDVQMMNPVLQALNERNLSGRDTLILGTSILYDKSLRTQIEKAMSKIKNVVVATPLIENMPQKFIDELQKEHHISILGRYQELPNTGELSTMKFIPRRDLDVPKKPISLKETTTAESNNPLIFSVGVDRIKCEDVLDLTDQNEEARLKVGIICDWKNGGRYVILGTEFADMKTSVDDKNIPAQWLRKMLSSTLNNKRNK